MKLSQVSVRVGGSERVACRWSYFHPDVARPIPNYIRNKNKDVMKQKQGGEKVHVPKSAPKNVSK
jgi:hypothetical protein